MFCDDSSSLADVRHERTRLPERWCGLFRLLLNQKQMGSGRRKRQDTGKERTEMTDRTMVADFHRLEQPIGLKQNALRPDWILSRHHLLKQLLGLTKGTGTMADTVFLVR